MQLHEMNLWQVMIFRLYILYNKHKMIKIGTQNREISQVLSQVLEYFFCRLYMFGVVVMLVRACYLNANKCSLRACKTNRIISWSTWHTRQLSLQ